MRKMQKTRKIWKVWNWEVWNGADEMRRIFLCTAIVGALALHAGSAWAARDALLTSVKGETSSATGALDSHAELIDGDELETGDESGCSVLLDESAVVELCGRTRISFATDKKRGNRIVNIESGTVRMIIEPREPGERIEIHTPAAIATILGSIIYVTVDPVTGEVTFTSSDSQINIRERDDVDCTPIGLPAEAGIPRCAEGTTIGSLEQLTVMPGEKPREKKQVSEADLASLGGCLFDFHDLAAQIDRMAQANKATQRVLAIDIAAVNLPPVALEVGTVIETESGNDIEVDLQPTDTNPRLLEPEMPPPIDCGGIPCDHGDF